MNVLARSFKLPESTRHFNRNQRVWVILATGNQSAYVTAKYRGVGRWVKAWVKWKDDTAPKIEEFAVEEKFCKRRGIRYLNPEGSRYLEEGDSK